MSWIEIWGQILLLDNATLGEVPRQVAGPVDAR
jgi:hypothetical protein